MILEIPMYQVDAFTSRPFGGNPAAVCILDREIPATVLQNIAAENNLAETAYLWKKDEKQYHIRWFTPTIEVDLCGHATIASAFTLFDILHEKGTTIQFDSKSGPLYVSRSEDGLLTLDFPIDSINNSETPKGLSEAIGAEIIDCKKGKSDFLVRVQSETILKNLLPDMSQIKKLPSRGLIVTAKGDEVDFVSRCFFPQSGINEDPVTGSAHTTLAPYWSSLLGKKEFIAKQISNRGGELQIQLKGERVLIGGYAVKFLEGKIFVEM